MRMFLGRSKDWKEMYYNGSRSRVGRPCTPVSIRGTNYRSMTEAAKAFRVSPSLVHYHYRNKSLDRLSQGKRSVDSITLRGEHYITLKAIAEAYNIPYHRVCNANRKGYLHKVIDVSDFRKIKTHWRGLAFSSRAELARHLGLPTKKVYSYASLGKLDELQASD